MKPLFIQYPKCGTCQKAAKWLKANQIETEQRDITIDNPTREELEKWIAHHQAEDGHDARTNRQPGLPDGIRGGRSM